MVIAGIDPNQQKAGEITRWAKGYWEVVHPYSANGRYEIHPPGAVFRLSPHRRRVGQSVAPNLLEVIRRCVASGRGFQDFRSHMGTRAGRGPGNVFADLVQDRAQKRGGNRIEHERPQKKELS